MSYCQQSEVRIQLYCCGEGCVHPFISSLSLRVRKKFCSYVGSCQNYGPLLGTVNSRCRIISGTQKGTIILTTTHIPIGSHSFLTLIIYNIPQYTQRGFRTQNLRLRVLGFGIRGLGIRAQGLGLRVKIWSSGLRVWGSGLGSGV